MADRKKPHDDKFTWSDEDAEHLIVNVPQCNVCISFDGYLKCKVFGDVPEKYAGASDYERCPLFVHWKKGQK